MLHLKINTIFTSGADLKEFPSIFKNALLTTFEIAEMHPQDLKYSQPTLGYKRIKQKTANSDCSENQQINLQKMGFLLCSSPTSLCIPDPR